MPLRFERLAKPAEQGRFERLALQAIEQVGQENKVMRALVDGRQDAADAAGQRQGEGTLESQHSDQRKRSRLEKSPADHRGGAQQGQQKGDDTQADARKDAWGFSPLREGHGIDARAYVGAEQLEILPEVEPGAQLVDRRVPLVDGLGRSGRQEPCRECLFASARSRRAKTLEERALAKEIEIGRVGVIDIQISQAVHAGTGPAVIQPRQALGIELHGPGGSTAEAAEWFVNQYQNDEDRERQGQPVGARPVDPVDEEPEHEPGAKNGQPEVGNPFFEPEPPLMRLLPLVQTALVLGPQAALGSLWLARLLHGRLCHSSVNEGGRDKLANLGVAHKLSSTAGIILQASFCRADCFTALPRSDTLVHAGMWKLCQQRSCLLALRGARSMSSQADVRSIDALKDFRVALALYEEDTLAALGAVEAEVRRTSQWLLQDRPVYWQEQIKRRREQVTAAKSEVFRRQLQKKPDYSPSMSEPMEILRKAEASLQEAEKRLTMVRKWQPLFQQAVLEYHGSIQRIKELAATDVPRAVNSAVAPHRCARGVSPARTALGTGNRGGNGVISRFVADDPRRMGDDRGQDSR